MNAARPALAAANKTAADIDMVIVGCAYTQRSYPAIAIEVQQALGIEGFGFDMLVACSAATFALQRAYDALAAGSARGVLVINPELTSPQVNYCDRDSHFIFGDVSTAVVLENESTCRAPHAYRILGTRPDAIFEQHPLEFRLPRPFRRGDPTPTTGSFTRTAARYSRTCVRSRPHISKHRSRPLDFALPTSGAGGCTRRI